MQYFYYMTLIMWFLYILMMSNPDYKHPTQALGTTEPHRVPVLRKNGLFSSNFLQSLITMEENGSLWSFKTNW